MDFLTGEASFYAPPKYATDSSYVFFPGCQLGAFNPEHVLKSYDFLSKVHNAGVFISCCGAPAYWAGDITRLEGNFEEIRRVWRELGGATFAFACATCESLFSKYLPEVPRVSLYELMAQSDEIKPGFTFETASVFDPCNSRGNDVMETAVRELAQKSGTVLVDLPEKNRCCGYGGHIRVANPELYGTITENRAGMGENPYIVYCANCREVFLSLGKSCVHIIDAALNLKHDSTLPKLQKKRENALKVKTVLMKNITGKDFSPTRRDWDSLELILSDELAESIEKKLISLSDIRETIWHSETTGDKILDDIGLTRCCLEKPVLTYWVAYKIADGGSYEVLEAYSHRMRFSMEDT